MTNTNNMVENIENKDKIVLNGTIKLTFKTCGLDLVEKNTRISEVNTFNGVNDDQSNSDRTKEVHLAPTESSVMLEFDETAIGYGRLLGAIGQLFGCMR